MAAWRYLSWCLLAACRFHFDPLADDGGRTDDSGRTDDGSQACGIESCNGLDDNCDGVIDENCSCTPFDIEVASPVFDISSVAWTGSGYVFALPTTSSDTSLYPVDAAGLIGTEAPLAGAAVGTHSMVWTGTEVVLAYLEAGAAWTRRVGADGQLLAPPVRIDESGATGAPLLVRRGASLGAVWQTGSLTGILRELALDGTPSGASMPLQIAPSSLIQVSDRYLILGRGTGGNLIVIMDSGVGTTYPLGGAAPRLVARISEAAVFDKPINSPSVRRLGLDGSLGNPTIIPDYGGGGQVLGDIVPTATGYRVLGLSQVNPLELLNTELDQDAALISGPTAAGTSHTLTTTYPPSAISVGGRQLVIWPYTDGAGERYELIQSCP
jgi:hypothetical protein